MNIKNNLKINNLLRLFLGLTFLSAGIFRVFNWNAAVIEFSGLNLSTANYLIVLIIALEIIGGLLLILNIKIKEVLLIFSSFIVIAIIIAFMANGNNIIANYKELFTFTPSPTDTFLHFTYLIILIYLINKKES
jgi:uncharacterized membrane protein YphA (DoxX/SURF4 family)